MNNHKFSGWQPLFEQFRRKLAVAGFDLAAAFPVELYNNTVAPDYRMPDFGQPESLAVIIGNTKSFWEPFVNAYHSDPAVRLNLHPIDAYSERTVCEAADASGVQYLACWAHFRGSHRIAIQRAALAGGLAAISPSNLSVHPEFGPWIAWRALVCFNLPGPDRPSPTPPDICNGCEAPCMKALERAITLSEGVPPSITGALLPHWEAWVEVRNVCPVGQKFRYSDHQIRYHYTKDPGTIHSG